jgi:hypothetical protein
MPTIKKIDMLTGEQTLVDISDADHYRTIMAGRVRLVAEVEVYNNATATDQEVEAEYIVYLAELDAHEQALADAFQSAKDAYIALRDYTPTAVGQITGAGNQTAIVAQVELRVIAIETALDDIFKVFKYLKVAGVADTNGA